MRVLAIICLVSAPAIGFAQSKTEYPALKQRFQRGNYAEAKAGYEELLQAEKPEVAAYIGLARCRAVEGDYTEAIEVLDHGLKQYPDRAELLAQRADLQLFLGRWNEASRDAEAALMRQDNNMLARWVRVRLLRDSGAIEEANKEVRWFVRAYSDASAAGKEIADAEALVIIGQAGAENARWNNKPQQYTFILNEVYKDALKSDPDCWFAENLAGRLLAEKHNRADAGEAFDHALKINPKAVEALVGQGRLLLEELNSQAAGRLADQALKVNPRHPEALLLKADVRLAEGDAAAAERLVLAAKLVNRRDERTLARLAAIHVLARKEQAVDAVVKEVSEFRARPGVFYAELAEALTSRKQYPKAEECFKKAIELRPDLSSARAGLGLLLMQLGREPEARIQLEAAFKADPFHVRVSNALKVLKHLDAYTAVETAHFVIKFDSKNDKVQAAFVADYLEQLHAEFSKQYGYAPPGKTLVEIIATREMFSGRVLSLPGLPGAAQGASTGPLIAIPSPHADGAGRRFNWGVVVRHELTHVFNLTQTGFLVPIWLTEGLAVRAEHTRRLDGKAALLRERLASGTAFDLDTINRGYHNFGQPDDVILAYYQGYLYVDYIARTHGAAAIAALLEAYRQGLDTGDALRRACGVEKDAFEKGYREYVRQLVRVGPRMEKPMTATELELAHKKNPEDADVAARLASEHLRRGKVAEARKLAEAVLAIQPTHAGAALVMARLLQREKNTAGAQAILEAAAKDNADNPRVLMALARLYVETNKFEEAAKNLEAVRTFGSPDGEVLELLAKIYSTTKRTALLVSVLEEVAARTPDDLEVWLNLAKLHRDAGRYARAEACAREALFVDLGNEEARKLLMESLRAQGKDREAEQLAVRFTP
jgi:tetratricopeptide (TPR) repeat protein